ncbi:MAG: ATP-binding protein [Rivularia sp. (in: cyanobacteria)]
MSIQHYPLYEFISRVPSCYETTPIKEVLSFFEQEQHSVQLVVLNEQQVPCCLLDATNLLEFFIYEKQDELGNTDKFDWNRPISCLDAEFIQPIQILSSSLSLEQFGSKLRTQKLSVSSHNWVLVNEYNKLLGLLDSCKLLRRLASSQSQNKTVAIASGNRKTEYQEASNSISVIPRNFIAKTHSDGAEVISYTDAKNKIYSSRNRNKSQWSYKYAAQLLKGLPWALMLETDTKEVVSQNQLWYEQLGELKDPQGFKELWENTIEGNYLTQTDVEPELNHSKSGSTLNRCFIDSEPGSCVCVVEMQDGQERVWRFTKIPVDICDIDLQDLKNEEIPENGQLWLVLATDITEQQQLTQELAAKNADLIQLNRLKDEFLACISHELKTPLTAVLGLSRLLSDQQLGKLNDRQAKYAKLIHQSGRHLMSVVNDILDLTRMETGQMTLTPTKVNIKNVCDRALKEAKAIHTQTSKAIISDLVEEYQFVIDIESGLEEIVADELRLRQMLIHLLSNAFKFTEAGGEIGLQINSWEGWIAFTVWDTGIGIADSQQHLIFQKFQQLENPMTRQHEGTGLGLVLTRALARLHGGDVSFLSREGSGSQFTVLLPPSPPQKMLGEIGLGDTEGYLQSGGSPVTEEKPLIKSGLPKELAVENIPASTSKNNLNSNSKDRDSNLSLQTFPNSLVLVVETVARYIDDFTKHLSTLGYRVVVARSGCEALEKARRLQPIAIFINPLLPILSGWDVLTLIKSDVATRDIATIVTASAAEKEQAFSKRADYFLNLPVTYKALAGLLETISHIPVYKPADAKNSSTPKAKTPLRILRLVEPEVESLSYHPSLGKHRVIEADDLEQAQLLARVWKFDVALLDVEMPLAETYLEKIAKNQILAALPLVTRSVETTQAASKIGKLSVFPCLTELGKHNNIDKEKASTLLSVLQIAAGVCCPPSILVVDLTVIPDLPGAIIDCQTKKIRKTKKTKKDNPERVNLPLRGKLPCPLNHEQAQTTSRPTEWFQALVQYLQTAGFKAAMCNSWKELLQLLRHESVDLLLICLGESTIELKVQSLIEALEQMAPDLLPVLLLDQRSNSNQIELEEFKASETIAAQVLPRSISMENLLIKINQALAVSS